MSDIKNNLADIDAIIGYHFKNAELRTRAFTHVSYVNEHSDAVDNERLEFIGDAVVNYVIGMYLYTTYPNCDEGFLTSRRASLVKAETQSKAIDKLGLIDYLRVGKGDRYLNPQSASTKCDLFEAIAGAILMDNNGDLTFAKKFILDNILPFDGSASVDYKSAVFIHCSKNKIICNFSDREERENGFPKFYSTLFVDGVEAGSGSGMTKKDAQQAASKIFADNNIH